MREKKMTEKREKKMREKRVCDRELVMLRVRE